MVCTKKHRRLTSEEIRRIAVHESGHATVALVLIPERIRGAFIRSEMDSEEVTLLGNPDGLGGVKLSEIELSFTTTHMMQNEMAALAGGYLAEAAQLGGYTLGCAQDLREIANLAARYINVFGLGHKEGVSPISFETLVHAHKLAHSERRQQIWEAIERLCEAAHEHAKRILLGEHELQLAIAAQLFERSRLSRRQLLALKKRYQTAALYLPPAW